MTKDPGSRLFQPEIDFLRWVLLTPILMLFVSSTFAQTAPASPTTPTPSPNPSPRPQYRQLRYDEDWSFLSDPTRRTEAMDRIKYIPLNARGDWYLSIGGEVRQQYERYRNPGWGREPRDNNGYWLQRLMLHADLHMGSSVRTFVQIKSGLESGRAGGPRPVDEDKLDLNQAFVDITLAFKAKRALVMRLGRQEMLFGSARLVGPRDGPNVRLSFDGVRTVVGAGAWRVDAFIVKPVETNGGVFDDASDHAQTFWGVYAVRPVKSIAPANIDLYYLGIDRKLARFDQGLGRETRHTIGMRLWGQRRQWDYNSEIIFQLGSFDQGNINAWAVASDVGYMMRAKRFRPRLGLKADIASGDRDGSDRDLQTFNTLFPRGQYFGDPGIIGLANIVDLHPSLELYLTDHVKATVDWDFFWRESTGDGIYGNGLNLLRSGQTSLARYIGSQPTVLVEWKVNSHLTLEAAWTYFFAGRFLKETVPGRNLDYITARVTYKF
jgi:alginate export protein